MTQVWEDIKIDAEFAALIPPLSAEERQQLEENIVEHGGVRDPLVVWSKNGTLTLIDGHNRYEICTRLELDFDIKEMRFSDRSHAEEWIIRNQFGRRNLPVYDRVILAKRLEEVISKRSRQGERTDLCQKSDKSLPPLDTKREIAKVAGVSHDTVAKVKKIEAAVAAGKIAPETIDQLRHRGTSINRVVRDLKEQETTVKRLEQKAVAITKRQDVDGLYLGDFREIGDKVPDASVDLIFTDPPYDRKAIELYDGLGEFAARVLRPGGSLIAYVGHIQLPYALADLSKHLRYWWTCGCFHSEAKARMTEYGIVAGWKPIVWFVKETRGDKQTFITDVVTGAREKSHHDWQQAVSEARYFIDLLTQPDDFVVDPFCGGGTTPVACIESGRKWASFEIDEANFSNASSRIKEAIS